MSRADREAEALARLEYNREHARWDCRLCTANNAVVVDVWGIERRALIDLLDDAIFANAPGRGRGTFLRLELEPSRLDRIL